MKNIISLVVVLSLTACGFHLRGSVALPHGMEVTYVQDMQPASRIALPLRQTLISNGARVAETAEDASALVRIVSERFDRRLLSTGRTSKEKDYELLYAITFAAQARNETWAVDAQEIRVTREMKFDEEQVLAKNAEQEQLQTVMVQDAARQILLRLQSKAK